MTTKPNAAPSTEPTSAQKPGSSSGAPAPDPITASVEEAMRQVNPGASSAKEPAPKPTPQERKPKTPAAPVAEPPASEQDEEDDIDDEDDGEELEPDDEPADGDDGEDDGEPDHAATLAAFSAKLKAMKPGELLRLADKDVPEEFREAIAGLKTAAGREWHAIATAKKSGKQQSESADEQPQKPKELSDEELFDLASSGAEGFKRATEIQFKRLADAAFKERGIEPETPEAKEVKLVESVRGEALKIHKELSDPAFEREVGEMLSSPRLQKRVIRAIQTGDAELLLDAVDDASERVKAERLRSTEVARAAAKKKRERETETAKEQKAGTVASTATSKGNTEGKKRPSVESSIDDAIKETKATSFR